MGLMCAFKEFSNFTLPYKNELPAIGNKESSEKENIDQISTDELIQCYNESYKYIDDFVADLDKQLVEKNTEIIDLNHKVSEVQKKQDDLSNELKTLTKSYNEVSKEQQNFISLINDASGSSTDKPKKAEEQLKNLKTTINKLQQQQEAFGKIKLFPEGNSNENLTLSEIIPNKVKGNNSFPSLKESIQASKLSATLLTSSDFKSLTEKILLGDKFSEFIKDLCIFEHRIGPAVLEMFNKKMDTSSCSTHLQSTLGIYGFKGKDDIDNIPTLIKSSGELQNLSVTSFADIKTLIGKIVANQDEDLLIRNNDEQILAMKAMLGCAADEVYESEFKQEVAPSRIEELNLKKLEKKTKLFLEVLLKYILNSTGIEFTTFEDIVQKFKKIYAIVHHERSLLINFAELMKNVSNIEGKLDFESELLNYVSNEGRRNVIKKQLENIANVLYEKIYQYDEMVQNAEEGSIDDYDQDESGEQSEEFYEDMHNDGSIKYGGYKTAKRTSNTRSQVPLMNRRYISGHAKQ